MSDELESAINFVSALRRKSEHLPKELGHLNWRKEFLAYIANRLRAISNFRSPEIRENVMTVFQWVQRLAKDGKSHNTIHSYLEPIPRLFQYVRHRSLFEALRAARSEELYPPRRRPDKNHFAALRSLWRFISTNHPGEMPKALRFREGPKPIYAEEVLSKQGLEELNDGVEQACRNLPQSETSISTAKFVIAFLLLASVAGPRFSELRRLQLQDIVFSPILTLVLHRKGGKKQVLEFTPDVGEAPEWVIDFLQQIHGLRLSETQGAEHAPFFVGRFFSPGLRSRSDDLGEFLKGLGFDHTLHDLRHLFANSARARGTALILVINMLGHSTFKTAPRNYLQIYPLLQRRESENLMPSQCPIELPDTLTSEQFAVLLGIGIQGAYVARKAFRKANGLPENSFYSRSPISLSEALSVMTHRIKRAQSPA